ncbi:MAG: nuclease-related domain-containing DEAD/DEAH box helicase [Candidatus Nanopelagicales bacterium]
MPPKTYPRSPDFADESERMVWDALAAGLRDEDVLMHGVRFTDRDAGEVEIDLLVLMPDSGAAVIEVKGGFVRFADGGWTQSDGRTTRRIDPVGQARKGVYALRRYLEERPDWSRGRVRSTWVLAFPYAHEGNDFGPQAPRGTVIDEDGLALAGDTIYSRLWDRGLQCGIPAAGWADAAVRALIGAIDAPAEIAGRTAARLRHADQLTSAQAAILTAVRANPRFEVRGAAGTGKTWLAMEQARRWAEDGQRVCFVSYGRGAAEMATRAMASLPPGSRPAFVGTFHQLGYRWGVHASGGEGQDFWERRAPAEMAAAGQALAPSERYSAFVIDEAQDFADSWWPALLSATADSDFRLAVFRDDEQSVFNDRQGGPGVDLVTLLLDENLRNAQQVVDTFRPLISTQVQAKGGEGFPVEFVECAADEVLDAADTAVADLVDRRGWLPEHVALLTTQHRHSVQAQFGEDKAGYWADLWANDGVFYSTVSGFKGLERPAVVLAVDGFHPGIDPRSVMYAGMSRARDLLVVVGSGELLKPIVGEKVLRRLRRGANPAWPPPTIAVPPR